MYGVKDNVNFHPFVLQVIGTVCSFTKTLSTGLDFICLFVDID